MWQKTYTYEWEKGHLPVIACTLGVSPWIAWMSHQAVICPLSSHDQLITFKYTCLLSLQNICFFIRICQKWDHDQIVIFQVGAFTFWVFELLKCLNSNEFSCVQIIVKRVIEKRQEIISISLTDAPAVSYKTFIFVTVFAVPQRWRLSSFAIRPQSEGSWIYPKQFSMIWDASQNI